VNHASGSAFPLLAVYAAAAFRLVPSLNRIVTAMNLVKQGTASAMVLSSELLRAVPPQAAAVTSGSVPFHTAICVNGLSFRHEGADVDSLRNVTLKIGRGEMVGFAGKSGSGKTTLIDCIIGLLVPSSGTVEVDGRNIHHRVGAWQAQIGYIPQHIYLTDESLKKNIALGLTDAEIDVARVESVIEAAQLSELVEGLPEGIETYVGEHGVRLSGGQRQRIGIARALYRDPAVLIMDEATSALDVETENAIVQTIAGLRGARTILIIAHRPATIAACDRVIFLAGGHLVEQAEAG
jgi:ABC-type multidrug transport system fused ATPase/permease subunit